jgi:hypothetical protein
MTHGAWRMGEEAVSPSDQTEEGKRKRKKIGRRCISKRILTPSIWLALSSVTKSQASSGPRPPSHTRVEPLHSESESEPTSNDKLPVISHNILISFAFGCGRPLPTRNPLHSLHGFCLPLTLLGAAPRHELHALSPIAYPISPTPFLISLPAPREPRHCFQTRSIGQF